jgi:hypothetical protein
MLQRNVVSNAAVMCEISNTEMLMLDFEMVLYGGAEIAVPNAITK